MSEKRATLEEAERKTTEIGRIIGDQMPKGWGFALLIFSFGEQGFMNWVSNAQRADMIKALRECADRLEKDRRDFHRTERKS